MLTSAAFVWSVVVDYLAWQRDIDEAVRSMIRLRWDILIMTPFEDLVIKFAKTFYSMSL